jgi:ubiquinone/menaquinone biosynthesis C-methylase UbiE
MARTEISLSVGEIREANIRYHDAAAQAYDSKWAIDYGEVGARQVTTKLAKAIGRAPGRYRSALEVGAGTGYFSLNLLKHGVIESATATDISPGMLAQLERKAEELELDVTAVTADAEQLPFATGSFDIVLGHAVLHHIPDLQRAMSEFRRVLSPGGTLAFMGEPSRHGDRIAALPKRLGMLAAPAWKRLLGVSRLNGHPAMPPHPPPSDADHGKLEMVVDVHTFTPAQLRSLARGAGFVDVRVTGEELVANAYGWLLRTLEAGTDPEAVPHAWHVFAFRSYLGLQWLDGRVLEPYLPPAIFYNLLLSARAPEA